MSSNEKIFSDTCGTWFSVFRRKFVSRKSFGNKQRIAHSKQTFSFVSVLLLALILNFVGAIETETAFGFAAQDDQTVGAQALHFRKRANIWSRLDLTAVDGFVKTSPPDAIKYDRKMEAFLMGGGDFLISSNLSVRTNVKANWMINKEEEKDPPKSPIERSISVFEPSAIVTFINPKGLEMYAGVAFRLVSAYTETQTSATASSKTQFDAVNLLVPRFGVIRRAGAWNGGLYFVMGREGERPFSKTASDGSSSSGIEPVYMPTVFGVIADFRLSVLDMELDLATVQASGGGQKSADGIGIKDDYLRFKTSGFYALAGGGIQVKLGYNTLSYSSNAFMNIDTIPVFSSQFLFLQGNKDTHVYYGLIYGYASDGQSIPEFNADYKFHAVGLTTGLFIPM